MDFETIAIVGSALSAGKIIYELGSKVADMFSDDDEAQKTSTLSGLSSTNNAKESAEKGKAVDYKA